MFEVRIASDERTLRVFSLLRCFLSLDCRCTNEGAGLKAQARID